MKNIIAMFFLLFSTCSLATPLHNMVVFGDSLSDNGNLYEYMKHQFPQDPPYYQGRFSNGPVWIEQLVELYYSDHAMDHLLDYAFGGAGVMLDEEPDPSGDLFTLDKEIDSYLLAHQNKASDESLYVVWIGSNNYLAMPDEKEKTVHQVVQGIKKGLQRLAANGAKHIMVVGIPDLGKTPAAVDEETADLFSFCSIEHNRQLKEEVAALKSEYPETQWLYLSVVETLEDALTYPEKYGFSKDKVMSTCFDAEMADENAPAMLKFSTANQSRFMSAINPCPGYLFFDPVHPTTAAHAIMAHLSKELIDEAGIVFE